jgi:transformation/transcription domain-associated protein
VNLADYRKLSIPLLEGLARLLELLSNWFNVTLGEKLLDYLKKWTEPDKIAATKIWKQGDEPKIAAAIIELFHLLPPSSSFLDRLVALTINLESLLQSTSSFSHVRSPYRAPLTKFLNRYATESVDFFLERMANPPYFKLFLAVLCSEIGGPVREELSKNIPKLMRHAFELDATTEPTQAAEVQFQGLLIVRILVKFIPDWLGQNEVIFNTLTRIWQSAPRQMLMAREEEVPLQRLQESKILVKCFLNYCRSHPEFFDVLFLMLGIFQHRTIVDFTFLKEFYIREVAEGYSVELKKKLLHRFLEFFKERSNSNEMKVYALQLLIIPTLTSTFRKKDGAITVDQQIVQSIVKDLLDPTEEVLSTYDEPLRVELLQLATLLIRHMPKELVQHRKELIKFAWDHLKREDTTSKQWAYVNVCRFIEAYDAPHKIILQVYVALLRAFQPEARPLLKQALDILTPALPKRLPAGDHKYPIWIRTCSTRRAPSSFRR